LGGFEAAIPDEVDGDFAIKQRTVVVMEELRVALELVVEVPGRCGKVKEGDKEGKCKKAVKREESWHFWDGNGVLFGREM